MVVKKPVSINDNFYVTKGGAAGGGSASFGSGSFGSVSGGSGGFGSLKCDTLTVGETVFNIRSQYIVTGFHFNKQTTEAITNIYGYPTRNSLGYMTNYSISVNKKSVMTGFTMRAYRMKGTILGSGFNNGDYTYTV